MKRDNRRGLWPRLLATCLGVFATGASYAVEIDFTRYLLHLGPQVEAPVSSSGSFFGTPGNARLLLTPPSDGAKLTIKLNGEEVLGPKLAVGEVPAEVSIVLSENNVLVVSSAEPLNGNFSVRVKQRADVTLHVESRVHFNTNVRDFDAARAFYGKLGFKTLTGFPDTNTLEMAHAIGITTPTAYDGSQGDHAGGYLLHGELVGVGGFEGGLMDLIEFTVPRSEEAPYAKLNHLGMAYAAMHTTNIAADYAYMRTMGVEFLAAPTARADGTKFAVFQDPDGTFYQLIEVEGEDDDTDTTHIVGLAHVNVNVSDFERSSAWYQMLGYEPKRQLANTESLEVANAMGFAAPYQVNGALFEHPEDGSSLELVQWLQPHNPERAYSLPVNHIGLHRMAYATSDIVADVAALRAQGVEFVSPITPCCSGPDSPGSIVAFYDPDGTIVELVEQPFMTELMAVLGWFKSLFD
ncbi:MAG: VOC family protein [Pseudomonadales bacterium]